MGRNRSPTGEGRDRAGPSSRYEVRVLQSLPHCTQAETHFQMHPSLRLVCSDHPEGSILSCLDSQFLRCAFEGRAYQYKVLPLWLSLLPHVFMKVMEAALVPMREHDVRILNYLDDWFILAHSREHRDLVLQHLSHLGLWVNCEKSKISPG